MEVPLLAESYISLGVFVQISNARLLARPPPLLMPENDSGAVIGAGGRAVIDATVTGPGTSSKLSHRSSRLIHQPIDSSVADATGTDNRVNNKRTSSTAISDSDSEDRGSGPPKRHWQRKKPNLNTETCTMKVSRRENASGVCGARLPPDEIGKMTRCRSCRAKGRNYKKISDDNIRGVRKHESLRKAGDEDCDEEKGDPARCVIRLHYMYPRRRAVEDSGAVRTERATTRTTQTRTARTTESPPTENTR